MRTDAPELHDTAFCLPPVGGDRRTKEQRFEKVGTDEHRVGRWVVGVSVKTDFVTHSGSSELSLDSESKLEPSVAKARLTLTLLN